MERIDRLLEEYDNVTAALRVNYAVGGPEHVAQLNKEYSAALTAMKYDPDNAPQRPSPEDVHRAAQQLFARLKKLNLS
jgi:hypothetical protein